MKTFQLKELRAALCFAAEGGQALHLMPEYYAHRRSDTPSCFKGRGEIAHLFDRDRARLIGKAKKLGVRVIKVERDGTDRQHVDLCGAPLRNALAQCANDAREAEQRGLKLEDIKP